MINWVYDLMYVFLIPFYGLFLPARVDGLENIPAEGGFIICCNHMHARDPFYLSAHCRSRRFHYMAKAELFRFKPLGAILRWMGAFPVDRGHNDLNAMRTALKVVADGHGLGLFPQGTRSRDNTRTPMLTGTSMIALRSGAPVIPAYIGGPYRLFRRIQVSYGKPIELADLGRRFDSNTLSEATRRIEEGVWSLKKPS